MEDNHLEEAFRKIKDELPVNEDLKRSMRHRFIKTRKNPWVRRISVLAAAAAVILAVSLSYIMTPETIIQKASAASLKISNFASFIEIAMGEGVGVSEYKGTVYVPVSEKGVYAYSKTGFKKILDKEMAGFVRVSHDGQKLALSSLGNISIYDLKNKKLQTVLKTDNQSIYYEEPSWSPDDKNIVYTRAVYKPAQTHGFTKGTEVYMLDLNSRTSKKLTTGSHGSLVGDGSGIIFEKDQKIVFRDLKTGKEKVLDSGRFPSLSPDGSYVAYVKNESTVKNVASNAKVAENISNVWIADAGDFKTKKRVTSNFPKPFMDVNEWVKSLKPSDIPQVLSFNGQYDYYEPVWGSDSRSLYVIRNLNSESRNGMKLVKIDFSTEKQTAENTVRNFLQAMVVRDDDFAKSLMKNPPAILTVSNPHNVGYKILGSGKEGSNVYVDAELYSAYTASPDYNYSKARFWLSAQDNGYIINKIDFKDGIAIMGSDAEKAVYMVKDKAKTLLFRESDIPSGFRVKGAYRFASLAYNPQKDTLVFTLQALQEGTQKASVRLLSYSLQNKQFKLLADISEVNGMANVGIGSIIVNSSGTYAALDLFSDDDKTFKSYCIVYNTETGKGVQLNRLFTDSAVDSVHTIFWETGYLAVSASGDGQFMRFVYNPEQEKVGTL